LFELLLSLALAATLAASLYASFNTALRARRSALAALEPMRNVSIAAEIIARDFDSATRASGTFSGMFIGMHQPGPAGDADGVQFYSTGADQPLNDAPLSEGIRRIEYVVRNEVTPPVLVRLVTRNLLPTTEPVTQEEIICRDVRSFSLRYYDGFSWMETWDSTQMDNIVPVAVAMTLELNDPEQPMTMSAGLTPSTRRITRVFPLSCTRKDDLISQMTSQ
jgi:type II secretion system protein J